MGCPARKVVSAGCGSFLLQKPSLVRDILREMRLQTSKPLSAKIRVGYTRDQENGEIIARMIAEENFDLLTIHGRTRSEGYNIPVNTESIYKSILSAKKVKEIPIIANGDVFSWQDALLMIEKTKADGVMLARGILGNPWLIQEILHQKTKEVTLQEWKDLVFKHISYQKEYYGNTEHTAILMRKQLLWYCTGFYGIKALRHKLNHILSLEEAQGLIEDFSNTLTLDTIRTTQPHVLSKFL
jgi:tRNA-dihydrouridine synthase B